ncbi:hypothetical protein PG993_004352 [Apiospora rasikravindrae]|uniref:Uncharacterized protein n=1 Tax=Apiospora rasikravindrae TaxID=990691 RepID=A0ABR1TF92_9PEZI
MSTTTRKILFRSLSAWYVVFAAGHVQYGFELFQKPSITQALPAKDLASYKANFYGGAVLLLNMAYLHYRWSFEGLYTRSEIRILTAPVMLMVSAIGLYYRHHGEVAMFPVLAFTAGFQALAWVWA